MNDSSTGGFLTPGSTPAPVEGMDLDAVLQQMIVGLTGIAGNLVRPRWQPVVPKQPEASVNWCAVGIVDIVPDNSPFVQHQADGSDQMRRDEIVAVLVSFYGPAAMSLAAQFRDGLYIAQNTEFLTAHGLGLIETSAITALPDLVNQVWIRRYDLRVRMYRVIRRSYPVLNLLHGSISGFNDTDGVTFTAGV